MVCLEDSLDTVLIIKYGSLNDLFDTLIIRMIRIIWMWIQIRLTDDLLDIISLLSTDPNTTQSFTNVCLVNVTEHGKKKFPLNGNQFSFSVLSML